MIIESVVVRGIGIRGNKVSKAEVDRGTGISIAREVEVGLVG